MKLLCIGQEWRGSNASGLFYALSRNGAITNVINDHRYISTSAVNKLAKVANRLVRSFQVKDFNAQIVKQFHSFQPDVVFVYKGAFVRKETVKLIKSKNTPVVVFFPDVSFTAHGENIPECIPFYDHIFTTKSFALNDLSARFGYPDQDITVIPHGFDPNLHRPLKVEESKFACDVSFIGNYSPHKAHLLENLIATLPHLDLRIWGGTWYKYKGTILKKHIQGVALLGDAYVEAINASKINIAILSEIVKGASSGDLITSRTFHITGSGGFMLHQYSTEVVDCFVENHEAVFFNNIQDLISKTAYFLENNEERVAIAQRGHTRSVKDHSLDHRAKQVLAILESSFSSA